MRHSKAEGLFLGADANKSGLFRWLPTFGRNGAEVPFWRRFLMTMGATWEFVLGCGRNGGRGTVFFDDSDANEGEYSRMVCGRGEVARMLMGRNDRHAAHPTMGQRRPMRGWHAAGIASGVNVRQTSGKRRANGGQTADVSVTRRKQNTGHAARAPSKIINLTLTLFGVLDPILFFRVFRCVFACSCGSVTVSRTSRADRRPDSTVRSRRR